MKRDRLCDQGPSPWTVNRELGPGKTRSGDSKSRTVLSSCYHSSMQKRRLSYWFRPSLGERKCLSLLRLETKKKFYVAFLLDKASSLQMPISCKDEFGSVSCLLQSFSIGSSFAACQLHFQHRTSAKKRKQAVKLVAIIT